MIIVIKERATLEQVEQMLETLRVYIKVVVDIERGLLCRRRRKTRGLWKLYC